MERILYLKYLRILWLDKKIKELKEKIRLKKLGCMVLIILLSGCAAAPIAPNNFKLIEDECVLQAFIKEDPILFEKEKIYSSILSFRKFAPNGTIHYFFWYIDKTYLCYIRNEWWIKRTRNRILANYRYYKKTNEKLKEVPIDPIDILRKAIFNEN